MAEAIDYSSARPGGAYIAANGKHAVGRYLYPGGKKGTTASEIQSLRDNGLVIWFVYEESGKELYGGFGAGVTLAQRAEVQRRAVGLPDNTVIYFTVDFDITGATLAAVVQAVKGAASVLGYNRTGFYGGAAHVDAVRNARACKYFWQTASWSGGRIAQGVHIHQYRNKQWGDKVDFDRTLEADFGGFGGPLYQLHNDGSIFSIFMFTGKPSTGGQDWKQLGNNPATVDIVADGNLLYQLHNDGHILKYTGIPLTGWQELDNNPNTKKIVASGGNLYQLHQNGLIWVFTGIPITGWTQLDNNPATVDIVADGNLLYQLHNDGRIYKYTGIPLTGWQELGNNPDTRKIVASGGCLYQLDKNGFISIYTGTPQWPITGWKQLDVNPYTIDIVADGSLLYQLQSDGRILKYTGTPTNWQELGNNPDTRKIVASGGCLYQLDKNGFISIYTGIPQWPITGWNQLDVNPYTTKIVAGGGNLYELAPWIS